jgi:hypothetical protein
MHISKQLAMPAAILAASLVLAPTAMSDDSTLPPQNPDSSITVNGAPSAGASIGDEMKVTLRWSASQSGNQDYTYLAAFDAMLPAGVDYVSTDEVAVNDGINLTQVSLSGNPDNAWAVAGSDHSDNELAYVAQQSGDRSTVRWTLGGLSDDGDAGFSLYRPDFLSKGSVTFTVRLNRNADIGAAGNRIDATAWYQTWAAAYSLPVDAAPSLLPVNDLNGEDLGHVVIYTGALDTLKTNLKGAKLDGSEFSLTRKGANSPLAFVADGQRLIPATDGDASLSGNAAHIEGLDGDFTLRETKAPDGYRLDGRSFAISIHTDAAGIHVTGDKADRLSFDGQSITLADQPAPAPPEPSRTAPAPTPAKSVTEQQKLAQTGATAPIWPAVGLMAMLGVVAALAAFRRAERR